MPPVPAPPPPAGRHRRRGWLIAVAVLVVLALIAGGVAALVVSSGSSESPTNALRDSLAAARRSSGFRYIAVSQGGGQTQVTDGTATPNGGTQQITINGDHFRLVLVDKVVYFNGDVGSLESQLGLSAATAQGLTGTWVSVRQGDSPYESLEEGITTTSAISEVTFTPRSVGDLSSGRVPMRRVSGVPSPQRGQRVSGTAHLDYAAGSHLPSAFVEDELVNGELDSSRTTYSAWGKVTAPVAPASSRPYSSLPLGGGGGSSTSPGGGTGPIIST